MRAPIWRKGVATRPIGRRVSDGSPSSLVSKGRPARRPHTRRIVVPELPQSSAISDGLRPSKPVPFTTAFEPETSTATPKARNAAAVEALSPPRPRPRISTVPSQSAPNSNARCEIDLSPGTLHAPLSAGLCPTRNSSWTGLSVIAFPRSYFSCLAGRACRCCLGSCSCAQTPWYRRRWPFCRRFRRAAFAKCATPPRPWCPWP